LSILKGFSNILSLLEKEVNFQQNSYNISHRSFSMSPHYLAKFRSSNFGISANEYVTCIDFWTHTQF